MTLNVRQRPELQGHLLAGIDGPRKSHEDLGHW